MRETLVIVGAGGDLTDRLLLPGLGSWLKHSDSRGLRIIGAGRHSMEDQEWQSEVEQGLVSGNLQPADAREIAKQASWQTVDVSETEEWRSFVQELPSGCAVYLALPPAVVQRAIEGLHGATLPENLRLAVEKPFGNDQESAAELNAVLEELLPESQVFRVDHFLGFVAARALLPVRYGSRILELMWSSAEVDSIEIVFDESIALEGRAEFYEGTGALTDMLQSHLLLLLSLAAMEEPASMTADDIHGRMLDALRTVELAGDPAEATRRAQYTSSSGTAGYREEEGVDPESTVETLAELRLRLNSPRWTDTHVRLRSGKALSEDRSFIRFTFRRPEHLPKELNTPPGTELEFGLENPQATLRLASQAGVDGFSFAPAELTGPLDDRGVTPYGRVVGDFLTDGELLAVSGAISEECWRIIDPVVSAWNSGEVALDTYPAGSAGPDHWSY